MKHTVTAVALLLLGVAPVVSSTEEAELVGMRDDAFAEFQELVEQALVWRVLAVNFLGELKSHDVYTAIDLALIHREGTARYMPIRERLLAHTETSRWLSDLRS